MKTREKYLAAAFGLVIFGWFGSQFISSQFIEPLRTLQTSVDSKQQESDKLHLEQMMIAKKGADMEKWKTLSFPPSANDAQRLYQDWLTELAILSGFENIKITLEPIGSSRKPYSTIPVTVKANAKLRELSEFIARFESVEIMQRISKLEIISPSNEGDPELVVTLTAEGVAMSTAETRSRLFPQTSLFKAVERNENAITVVSNAGFPDNVPFCIRVGNEFLNVTGIDGNTWTVQRGVEKTFSDRHETGNNVELFPLKSSDSREALQLAMSDTSFFTKPAPTINYNPKLASTQAPPVVRGTPWSWKIDVTSWNPAFGKPKFEVVSAPQGVVYNDRTSSLEWSSTGQAEVGNHQIDLLVWGTNGRDAGFNSTVPLRIRNPNVPPKFDAVDNLKFFIGRETNVKIRAVDPDGAGKPLVYSLEQGPAGMTIDASTGEIKWKPTDDLAPQKLDIRIKVTDSDEFPEVVTTTIPVALDEDSARFTYLTGRVVRSEGDQQEDEAWVYDRSANRTIILKAGDVFQIADFELTLESIGTTFVILKRGDQNFRWSFEQPLTEMKPISLSTQPVSAPAGT